MANKTTSNNFLGLDNKFSSFEYSKFVILSVPYEESTTFGKGTKNAPKEIINASKKLELYDIEEDIEAYYKGIHTTKPLKLPSKNPSKTMKIIGSKVFDLINKNKIPIILGGEHSISGGVISAFAKKYNESLSILHLDAHADLRETYCDSKFNHACALKRMRDYCKKTVSLGIRSMDISERNIINKEKITIFDDYFLHKNGMPTKKIILNLTKFVYISLDIDILSPALLPDTGTPEPGGLGWFELINILRSIIKEKTIVGIDIVELKPSKYSIASNFITAKIIYKIITYIVKYNREI